MERKAVILKPPISLLMRHVHTTGGRLAPRPRPVSICPGCLVLLKGQHLKGCKHSGLVVDRETEIRYFLPGEIPTPRLVKNDGAQYVQPYESDRGTEVEEAAAELTRTRRWVSKNDLLSTVTVGNLPNGEYRYFVGVNWKEGQSCMCRSCAVWLWRSMEDDAGFTKKRDEHVRRKSLDQIVPSCAHISTLVAEYLRMDMLCVSCDKKTTWTHWGVPMCMTKECIENFMFWPAKEVAYAWQVAMKCAEKKGWAKPERKRK